MFWGLSPALDLQKEFIIKSEKRDVINIMIIGGCDARHILKTLSQAYRHGKTAINIHIIEGCPELIAKQLLLISIALTDPEILGLEEKTRLFMEVYGNSLLRSVSCQDLIGYSKHLTKMITDLEYMESKIPLINLNHVKYRERDYIETLINFWKTGNSNLFDICDLWDRRLRNALGVRYDTRLGVFDWDYNMRLRDLGGAVVSSQEFKHFRSTGVAFTWLESEVSRPNCSLAAGVFKSGEQFCHRGYIGDTVTGPYVTYGLHCEERDENMLKSSNGTYLRRSTDVTERNIMRILYELQFQEPFDPAIVELDAEHNLGMVTLAQIDAKLSDPTECISSSKLQNNISFLNLDYAKVYFHSSSALELFAERPENQCQFQVMFVGYNLSKRIKPPLLRIMEKGGLVIVEGCKFVLDMKKDDMKEFEKYVDKMAEEFSCDLIGKYDVFKDACAKLVYK